MSSGGPSSSSPWTAAGGRSSSVKGRGRRSAGRVRCAAVGGLTDQYRTLKIEPGASEMEVKKAFRQLALQYHPDVCKGRDCGVQFHQINEAYDDVMNNLKASEEEEELVWSEEDLWEEWMGWEGAGIRDYTSHINPYI